jgi:exosortase/archaeosortase family protein
VSPVNTPDARFFSQGYFRSGSFAVSRYLLLALTLTLLAVSADQFAAPILYSSSPLWATATYLLLVWRRGKLNSSAADSPLELSLPIWRLTAFLAAHGVLVLAARLLSGTFQGASGAMTLQGTLVATSKLCVLAPTILLFPLAAWRKVASTYSPEAIASLVVLFTFFPSRALGSSWPWYGQLLGRSVHRLAGIFVPGLAYLANSNPTLDGPQLDVTIVPECSGINGLELFDYLFGMVMFLDWNRLRKDRALTAYFVGLFAMLLGNAIRIISFVVLGNHGFAESISRFHVSAGWIFFSAVFLAYLTLTYGWMLDKPDAAAQPEKAS